VPQRLWNRGRLGDRWRAATGDQQAHGNHSQPSAKEASRPHLQPHRVPADRVGRRSPGRGASDDPRPRRVFHAEYTPVVPRLGRRREARRAGQSGWTESTPPSSPGSSKLSCLGGSLPRWRSSLGSTPPSEDARVETARDARSGRLVWSLGGKPLRVRLVV
jgi:hypothetical protein